MLIFDFFPINFKCCFNRGVWTMDLWVNASNQMRLLACDTHLQITWCRGATLQDLHHLINVWVGFFEYFRPHVTETRWNWWQWCYITRVTRLSERSRWFKCATWKISRVLFARQILSYVNHVHRMNCSRSHWFPSVRFSWLIQGKIPIFRVILRSWIRRRTLFTGFTRPEGKIWKNPMERLVYVDIPRWTSV